MFRLERLVPLTLGLYAIVDAIVQRLGLLQRVLFAGLFGVVALLIVFGPMVRFLTRSQAAIVGIGVGLSLLALTPCFFNDYLDPVLVATDIGTLGLPFVLYAAGLVYPSLYGDARNARILVAAIGIAAFVSALAFFQIEYLNFERFDPPHIFLIAFCWAWFCSEAPSRRWRTLPLVVAILGLAYVSSQRTNVVLWFVAALVVLWLVTRGLRLILLGSVIILLFVVVRAEFISPEAVVTRVGSVVSPLIEASRFRLLRKGADASLWERMHEAEDVVATMGAEWSVPNYLVGGGHGATYVPQYSFVERNVRDGRVHNIHTGPLTLYFRYGVGGLMLWVLLIVLLVRDLARHRRAVLSGSARWVDLGFFLAVLLSSLDFLLRNNLLDPVVGFGVAGYLVTREGPPE